MPPTKEVKQYYYERIAALHRRYAVSMLCRLFGVSRSGYYKWRCRRGSLNRYQVSQQILDGYIKALHEAHPSSGYRALNGRLRAETGWVVSNLSVLRSMRRLSIQARLRRNHRHPNTGEPHAVFPNVLDRRFYPNKPLSHVATDITHFMYRGIKYAFICFLDLFNNEMLEWNVGTKESMDFILPPLKRLLARERSTNAQLILHSDQGTQFASACYSYLLEQSHVTQSMSRVATPRDNAVIESIFGWFKEFLRSDYFPGATVPIRNLLERAVYDFNHSRPSHKLNYKTPVQFRTEQGFA